MKYRSLVLAFAAGVAPLGCGDNDEEAQSSTSSSSVICDAGPSAPASVPGASAGSVSGRYLAKTRPGSGKARTESAVAASGALLRSEIPQIGFWVLEAPPEQADGVRKALVDSGEFERVEPDAVATQGSDPNDPCFPAQWHLRKIQAPAAWPLAAGFPSVTVAVVDSGVESSHPDLAGKVVAGWSFLSGTPDTSDVFGHGTSVAGAAAAMSNNATGVAGVAWQARIMPLVVLGPDDRALYSDIARAIIHAADQGVRVINVSLGGSTPSDALQSAVDYAWSRGSLVVASAMNAGNDTPQYPAACDKVVAVAATTALDTLAGFSSYGGWIDLSAPGSTVLTTATGGKYAYRNGTSFASPLVAGVAALLLAARPTLTLDDLVTLLHQSCDDLGAPGFDASFGWGRLNASRAVQAALAR